MRYLRFFFCVQLLGFGFLQLGNCQTVSRTSPASDPVCVSHGASPVISLSVTGVSSDASSSAWTTPAGTTLLSSNMVSAIYRINNVTSSSTFAFTVNYYRSGGAPAGTGSYSFGVTVRPAAFTEAHGPGNLISILSTDGPFDLQSLLNIPAAYTDHVRFYLDDLLNTTTPYITNSTGSNTFDPYQVSVLPSTYGFRYSVTVGGCPTEMIPIVNSRIRVFDGTGALPYFIQAVSAVPICENSTDDFYFDVLANCTGTCTMYPTYYNSETGTSYEGEGQTVSSHSTDYFNGLRKFRFHIDPSLVNPSTFSIPIRVLTSCSYFQQQVGYIPIQLKTPLDIYGLPAPDVSTDEINICSASLDTLFMQGGPGGGYFKVYKSSPEEPTPVLIAPSGAGSDLYPLYRNPGQDRSMQKIIPYQLYRDYALLDPSVRFRVVYVYSKFTSGACADSVDVNLGFLTPNSTDYTITAPSSVATEPLITYCYGDSLRLRIEGASGQYTWYLSDGFIRQTTSPDFTYMFASPGEYTIRLKSSAASVLPPGQCSNDVIRTIRVGAKPKTDFQVFNNFDNSTGTANNTIATDFVSTAELTKVNPIDNTDVIVSWSWLWGDNPSAAYIPDMVGTRSKTYTSAREEPYEVTHVATSSWGCQDTIVRYIPVFPIITPEISSPSVHDFNEIPGSIGWYESGQYNLDTNPLSSWVRVVPDGAVIKGTDAGWITSQARLVTGTNTTGYYNNERSWVESPCYDLRNLPLPMVSFDHWVQADHQFDGATLEYAVCSTAYGEEDWIPLGVIGNGKNWFNSNSIISAPGGNPAVSEDLMGWTGTDNTKDWLSSAYFLEEAKNRTSVSSAEGSQYIRFRIVFASNNDNIPGRIFDGFAFDNFFVGQRDRKVLVEEFCDYQNVEYNFEQSSFAGNPQLVRMQYHNRYMNLDDEINNQNKGETGARNLLYGYSQLPRAAVDGTYSLDHENRFFANKGEVNFNRRLLETSEFTITINAPVISGNSLNFSANLTRHSNLRSRGPFVIQTAVLEDSVYANGRSFSNVFRKFLPDAAGLHVDKNDWPVGTAKTIERGFTPFTQLTPRQDNDTSLILVVFIQDEQTSEVYQSEAVYVTYGMVKDLQRVPLPARIDQSGLSVSLFPNPAQQEISLYFNEGYDPEETYQYQIVDGFGKVVKQGLVPLRGSEAVISHLQELPVGIYQLRLQGAYNAVTKSFSIVR